MMAPDCRCGLKMRPCAVRDAWECRCGITVDGALAESGLPIPDTAFQQGEPWKEPEPGLRVSDRWSDIGDVSWGFVEVDPARFPSAEVLQRACADAFECSGLRYVGRPESWSRGLLVDGETLQRHRVYAIAPIDQLPEAIAAIVRFIHRKHGTGKVWAHGDIPIGPLKKCDSGGWRGAEIGGVLHAVLGCYYFHRPTN